MVLQRLMYAVLIGALCVVVNACGATSGSPRINSFRALPKFLENLDACLRQHGISHPEESVEAAEAGRTIPALLGTAGVPIPQGVTRTQFEGVLAKCGVTGIRVGRVPITDPVLMRGITAVRSCLASNGFTLPPPDFSGPGPVLNTSGIDFGSARWVATATGCSVTSALTQTTLGKCISHSVLAGRAKGAGFEDSLLKLPACLRRAGVT